MKTYYAYIMANWNNNVLYVGVTGNLQWRVFEHKNKLVKGFTSKYNVGRLVYYEEFEYIEDAIRREKNLKNWHREWKINQIRKFNPDLNDLSKDWYL